MVNMTDHAYSRMKERYRFNKEAAKRMAVKALKEGISHGDTSGRLHKYISSQIEKHPIKGSTIRIYGELIYIFIREKDETYTLVTVFTLPNDLRTNAISIQKRKATVSL